MSVIMQDASTTSELGEFRIDEESPHPSTRVLIVYGDADLHSAPELQDRLRRATDGGATTLVVDLSETAVVDSTSLGVLLAEMKRLRQRGGHIRLVVPRADVRRVFEITMLDRIFALHETQEAALTALSDAAG